MYYYKRYLLVTINVAYELCTPIKNKILQHAHSGAMSILGLL